MSEMKSEMLKYKGRLLEKEEAKRKLKLKLEGRRDALRDLLDPTEKVGALNGEMISETAVEFAALQIQYKEVQAEIAAIKKALGTE